MIIITVSNGQSLNSNLSNYDITWNTQSENPGESMPLGDGDVGLNAWVEKTSYYLMFLSLGHSMKIIKC
ncbi:DUF5703 domain-containing protein [Flavivirga amylovorans]|uniref:DUF5703 domain-containing protein n=1 Tax=Flavivirga amylovorans TaxID=870486 RepID=A0ABT8X7S5_9FLAO|nr:DUF5703 domain-containing protein [Flavivirga amylovorans]MDO5989737.1 DUF5703 domain-containing protein [Flavivirga amylovorans]